MKIKPQKKILFYFCWKKLCFLIHTNRTEYQKIFKFR